MVHDLLPAWFFSLLEQALYLSRGVHALAEPIQEYCLFSHEKYPKIITHQIGTPQ